MLTLVVLACFAYLVLINVVAIVFLVVGAIENAVRRHEEGSADYETLGASRFTIPVSVIVAAYNEGPVIEATVSSFLAFDYPEFEVVVVNDGSTDETLERLREAFELAPYEVFVRHVFPTQPVRGIYRSALHPNLVVVDKENGGKADAWNAALNVARYRYVCGVDADTVFDPTALLQVMRFPMSDPARVIGVTSQIATAAEPEKVLAQPPGRRRIDYSLLGVYQHLDFVRAFINNRLAWSQWGFMLCSPGGFQIWRRDVLEEVGGYSTTFTCEDIELTFRIHEKFRREGRDYDDPLPPRHGRRHRGAGRRRQARLAARALAAGHQRDGRPLPAHVVQPPVRRRRDGRRAVLPPHRGDLAGRRGRRLGGARGRGRPR